VRIPNSEVSLPVYALANYYFAVGEKKTRVAMVARLFLSPIAEYYTSQTGSDIFDIEDNCQSAALSRYIEGAGIGGHLIVTFCPQISSQL
jgi:hypothetical protein